MGEIVKATSALRDALDDKGWSYQIDEGGGAFYGPKINLKVVVVPLKVDFNLPQRFDLTYADSNSEKKRPIMIHKAVLGSLKRFFGVLIEHYAGEFRLWLSPVQAHVVPVTDSQVCKAVARLMFQLTQEPSTHLQTVTLATNPDSPPSDSTPLSTPSHSRTPPPIPQSSTAPL
ncbi:hypothetical protein C1H46_023182 [Malus baccata]|uniref:Threonyl-tRNA synthetase n=1 Tax=Malus baccata TaxID=106549 RepID=A0A540LXY6_MALBA|nr:hypothetical protein C1H46_023182 [Malus baccata]